MGDWSAADEIRVGVALDTWHPTRGTRLTGQRNTARRLVVANGRLTPIEDSPRRRTWTFPEPFGALDVTEVPLSEIVTISRHLRVAEVRSYMNLAPLADLGRPETPSPVAADESGRSAQVFAMDVVVRRGTDERRARVRGRDIYAVTAPLVVEAIERILDGRAKRFSVVAPGEAFDARDFIASLAPHGLATSFD